MTAAAQTRPQSEGLSNPSAAPVAGLPPEKPLDLVAVRSQITSMIAAAAPQMVVATIAKVCEGHYQPLKMLLEVAGLTAGAAPEEATGEDSLAEILLAQLQQPKDGNTARQPSAAGCENDTVK